MKNDSKLKPIDPKAYLWGLIGAVIWLLIMLLVWMLLGETLVDRVAGVIFALGAGLFFFLWVRTRNAGYLALLLLQGLLAARNLSEFHDETLVLGFRIVVLATLLVLFILMLRGRFRWYYREILDRAAQPVRGTTDGYTPRPLLLEKTPADFVQLQEFGKFLARNLIAFPYLRGDRLILVISRSKPLDLLNMRRQYLEDTYISFDSRGNTEVNIARREYEMYREELTFDELCRSLGRLMLVFLGYFLENRPEQILDELKGTRRLKGKPKDSPSEKTGEAK